MHKKREYVSSMRSTLGTVIEAQRIIRIFIIPYNDDYKVDGKVNN